MTSRQVITTAKGLFGKKIKRIKARLKAGYQVLLKDNQSH
ncbi:conjugative transposon protein TraM [Pedobacter panaciterrae]